VEAGNGSLRVQASSRRSSSLLTNQVTTDPGLTIIAYTAEPGSPSQQALDVLASWAKAPGNLLAVAKRLR
jgi:hypothetical protein